MIEVKSLTVLFNKKIALNNISFKINKGEIVALLGKNGAGKSTLLKSIVGIIKTDKNCVKTIGKVGWMGENVTPDPKLSVKEYLQFCGYIKKDTLVDDVIKQCELDEYKDFLCKTLSKGIQQRVVLASALIGSPEILILDEPSGGLDPLFQKEMIKLIKKISKDLIVILSTHNIQEVESLASRVIILKNGELSFIGNLKDNNYYEYF